MDLIQAAILGIVEGLTEFLPVSSTGHLILTAHILNIPHTNFTKTFEISIQLGSILAVLSLYYEKLLKDQETWKRIILAFIPTGILGFLLYKIIKRFFIGNDLLVVINLIFGGVVLLFIDRFLQKDNGLSDVKELSLKKIPLIGVFQSLAMMPGVSRSAATIIGGMVVGLNRRAAAEFSFLLALPTMLMATSYDLIKSHSEMSFQDWQVLLVGFVFAFFTAFLAIKIFISFISKHSFFIFGIYRIFIGILYFLIFLF
ncbi:MAG: Undecaprenyl-diphosphatase [Thermodesulfobacterium sp. 37_54]|uniref:undecaprenyl-diphosphate phosphatase n=1 Tax=Thermodesulfobacterium commune TaxID=1741 RepID=UPI000746442F|nr:MAG: Undecaprenyl-diphosphatase [Thermodesulfobacterium sp. 37_54]HBT04005.1 undecaprenyl-diphosphatase [Thermodesulfobacterium commune]HCE79863.1 undecaprenyl-diphosphatase [Thermodesulfobacterium commune]HCP10477.1 undecaprenyl-diphosphatase [Thermodesulfobacterium commune]